MCKCLSWLTFWYQFVPLKVLSHMYILVTCRSPSVYTSDDWVTVLSDKLFHLLLREALLPQILFLSLKLVLLHNGDKYLVSETLTQLSLAFEAALLPCKGLLQNP